MTKKVMMERAELKILSLEKDLLDDLSLRMTEQTSDHQSLCMKWPKLTRMNHFMRRNHPFKDIISFLSLCYRAVIYLLFIYLCVALRE